MITRRHILSSLPLLAAALTGRDGIHVTFEGSQACTSGKTIVIPALPLDSKPEVLATVRGHIDLQSAHIRYTDFRAVAKANMGPLQAWCWHIIEDWRVGQKMAAIYPGSRSNLNWLIARQCAAWAGDKPGKKPKSGQKLGANLGPNLAMSALLHVRATVLSWDVPEALACNASHTGALHRAYPALVRALDRLLANVRAHCPNTQSAIDHAARLAACLEECGLDNTSLQEEDAEDTPERLEQSAVDCGEGNASQSGKCDDCDAGMDSTGIDEAATGAMEETDTANTTENATEGANAEHGNTTPQKGNGAGGDLFEDQLLEALEQAPQSLGEALADTLDTVSRRTKSEFFVSPEEGKRTVKALDDLRRNLALRATVALKIRLQGLLQADTLRRSALGRRGKLHTQSLYRLAVGNPRLFLRTSDKQDMDTAVHILLDASGSMHGPRIELAADACYAVARALESLRGVSVGISVFPATGGAACGIFPLVRHDERVSDKFDIRGEGDTPLTEALWWALQQLAPRKEPRKLLLVLSDGQPNDRYSATMAFADLAKAGIECFGIGIMDTNIALLLPGSHCIINKLSDLAPTMFAMLQNAMRQGLGNSRGVQ